MRHWKQLSIGLIAVTLLPLGAAASVAASDPPPAPPKAPAASGTSSAAGRNVTLPTGDRVTLAADRRITFTPGAGRAGTTYATQTVGDHVLVIPADAWKSVATGKRNRNAFDVTRLAGLTGPLPLQRRVAAAADTVTLTVRYVDTAGRPAQDYLSTLIGLDDDSRFDLYDPDGTAQLEVPKGRYLLQTSMRTDAETKPELHLLVAPGLDVTGATTVVVDARRSKPVGVTAGNGEARPVQTYVGFTRGDRKSPIMGAIGGDSFEGLYTAQIGPAAGRDQFVSYAVSQWAVTGAKGDYFNTPVRYGVLQTRYGAMFTGLRKTVRDRELALLPSSFHAPLKSAGSMISGYGVVLPGQEQAWFRWGIGYSLPYDRAARTKVYLQPGQDWSGEFEEIDEEGNWVTQLGWDSARKLEAGRRYPEHWNSAVFGPLLNSRYDAVRQGESLDLSVIPYSDGAGHDGWSQTASAVSRLYRNGELVAEGDQAGRSPYDVTLPPEESVYRFETVADRQSRSGLSTHFEGTWTFRSAATTESTALPLWAVRFHPRVDLHNRTAYTRVTELPVEIQPVPGSAVGSPGRPVVEISGDDGKTWHRATLSRKSAHRYVARAATPGHPAYISVRTKLRDSSENAVEETIIRAYALR